MKSEIAAVSQYETVAELIAAQPDPEIQYNSGNALILSDAGITYDAAFFERIELPEKYRKIGTINGVTKTPYRMKGDGLIRNPDNMLSSIIKKDAVLGKLVYEFGHIETGLHKLVGIIFPTFDFRKLTNCTFRLYPSRNEGLHFDYFMKGAPYHTQQLDLTRVKIFLNIDSKNRIWHLGPTLKEYLRCAKDVLPGTLPADLNVLCYLIDKIGYLENCDVRTVEIPPGGAVIANGSTVAHEVVFGDRMAAIEATGFNTQPQFSEASRERMEVRRWIQEAGFDVSTDFAGFQKQYHDLPGSYERSRDRAAAAG